MPELLERMSDRFMRLCVRLCVAAHGIVAKISVVTSHTHKHNSYNSYVTAEPPLAASLATSEAMESPSR